MSKCPLRMAAKWLSAGRECHRVTIQKSMDPGKWLVRLEVGELGHGKCVWWGKDRSIRGALRGAFNAATREPQEPKP